MTREPTLETAKRRYRLMTVALLLNIFAFANMLLGFVQVMSAGSYDKGTYYIIVALLFYVIGQDYERKAEQCQRP